MANPDKTRHVVTGPDTRLGFPHLFTPRAGEDGPDKAKYEAMFMVPKTDKVTIEAIRAAEAAAAEEGKLSKFGGKIPTNLATVVKDGDEDFDLDDYPQCAGHIVFTARAKQAPHLVDRKVQSITDETELYAGCYVRASVDFYAYNYQGKKGIAAGLNGVQKVKDGDPLGGGRSKASDDFAVLDAGEFTAETDDDLLA